MKLAVAVASANRAVILHQTVLELLKQSRLADEIIIACPELAAGSSRQQHVLDETGALPVRVCPAPLGCSHQRNFAIDSTTADVIVFFDDDVQLDPDYLANCERILNAHPEAVGLGGWVVADGTNEAHEIAREDARHLLEIAPKRDTLSERFSFYGCNMAVRTAIAREVRFDEELRGYSIFEDKDFGNRVNRHGRILHSDECMLVHLATRSGRVNSVKFGMAQINTPIHCWRKGSFTSRETMQIIRNCVVANLFGLIRQHKGKSRWQRTGQLAGNLKAACSVKVWQRRKSSQITPGVMNTSASE